VHVAQCAPAGERQQHVDVVEHQVLHHVCIDDVPVEGAQALQLQGHDALALQQLRDLAHGGVEVLDVAHLHHRAPGAARDGVAQRLGVLDAERDGLLDQDVDTGAQGEQRVLDVQRAGRADRHRPDLLEQLLRAREGARVELPGDRGAALGVGVVDAAQLTYPT
jgi:hypothetical protein